MKKEKENTIIYTAAEIHKYLSGGCTPAEMHAMEKAALDDPFLAEAIEGFESMGDDAGWQQQLAEVKAQFNKKEPARVVPLAKRNNWWKIAAAVVVLGAGSILVYNASKKDAPPQANPQIAKADVIPAPVDSAVVQQKTATETPAATGTVVPAPASTPTPVTTTATSTLVAQAPPVKKTITLAQYDVQQLRDTTEGRRPNDFVYTPPAVPKDAAAKKPEALRDQFMTTESATTTNDQKAFAVNGYRKSSAYNNNNTVPLNTNNQNIGTQYYTPQFNKEKKAEAIQAKPEAEEVLKQTAVQYNHPFTAQVLGTDNTPLPFANVSIVNENFGTYADVKGNFKLISIDSLITVQVKSVGYLPRQFVLKSNGALNRLTLTEDETAFKDVTVIRGKSTGKPVRRATLVRDSVVNVEPADGWDNYSTYVSNNIDLPGIYNENNIHGEMEITFRVKPDQTIADIKVDNSLCSKCDEEAVKKLIEQGPQWKTKKGKAGKAKIKLQF